jgi:hypothetical protein
MDYGNNAPGFAGGEYIGIGNACVNFTWSALAQIGIPYTSIGPGYVADAIISPFAFGPPALPTANIPYLDMALNDFVTSTSSSGSPPSVDFTNNGTTFAETSSFNAMTGTVVTSWQETTPQAPALQTGSLTTAYNAMGDVTGSYTITSQASQSQESSTQIGSFDTYTTAMGDIAASYFISTPGTTQPSAEGFSQTSSTGSLQGAIAVTDNTSGTPSTTVIDTNSSGNTQTLNMSGIAPVVYASGIGNTNTATAGGSTPTILVGTDGSQLSDLGSGVFFMIGNNGSATAGSNSTIDILGNGNAIIATPVAAGEDRAALAWHQMGRDR